MTFTTARIGDFSIAVSLGEAEVRSPDAGALMAVDGTGFRGRPEPRFRL